MISPASLKRCYVCGRLQPLGDFYKRTRSADGRQAACKECDKARLTAPENRERRREADRLRQQRRRAGMTPEEKAAYEAARRDAMANETVEQRERRLAYFREYRRRQKREHAAAVAA